MTTNNQPQWYVVAGHTGSQLEQSSAQFVAVQALSADESIQASRDEREGFNPVTSLSEENLRKLVALIDEAKRTR